MPSSDARVAVSTGDCSPAALASPYSEIAWKKLYPINGHISSSMVHSARPLRISHSAWISSGLRGACWTRNVACERKKDILQSSRGEPRSRAEIVQRSGAANAAIGKQNEAVTNPLGVQQLMNRKDKCAAHSGFPAQDADDFANLPEIEAVERFVHEKQRVRREQPQRQQEPSAVTFRQRMDALVKNRRQTYGLESGGNLIGRFSRNIFKER